MIPVEVIFTADYFNAVYVATWMQSSSVQSVIAITITDLSQTMFMLYGLHCRTIKILSRLHRTVGDAADTGNMLSMICWLCRHPDRFETQAHERIRRRSCLPHDISPANTSVLDSLNHILPEPCRMARGLEHVQPHGSPRISSLPVMYQSKPTQLCCLRAKSARSRLKGVHPIGPEPRLVTVDRSPPSDIIACRPRSAHQRPTVLLNSLEALFTAECLIISAYLEAFMPVFYCIYMMVMVHLQSAQYHREMNGITRENVVTTIIPLFVFGILQIISFVILGVVIRNNCGMNVLYQLAFVLEKQMALVQCKMILWMLITLCFRVQHFGACTIDNSNDANGWTDTSFF
ncbi:unnamed protein product [Phytophthora fragariaefolia]|uniref:Unnamed protein product n=1 Tax=Phytophthora fragariaefolia TaxID=1490495 RepID=A0A9W6Y2V8_9STRA|nr:unnamed protein product [Phytophthora fragariaefolia]